MPNRTPHNEIKIPEAVSAILAAIKRQGHRAYIVGGCIRDQLLGRVPKDWDITTSMLPQDVIQLFQSMDDCTVIPTGLKHGTVTVMPTQNKTGYEITTFRTDGKYSDGRHPDNVEYTGNILDDLSRRDLTINAMAWSPDSGLIDPYYGAADLMAGRIKTVGDPETRFQEDPLRMMRAVRFTAQLDHFRMTKDVCHAIQRLAPSIQSVSQERRTDEIVKILKSSNPAMIIELEHTGLMEYVLPEVHALFSIRQNNPWHIYNAGVHTMTALEHTTCNLTTRLAVLFHDIGKAPALVTGDDGIDHFPGHPKLSAEMARTAMRRMRFPTDLIKTVTLLVQIHDIIPDETEKSVRRFANKYGLDTDLFLMYHDVKRADCMAQNRKKSDPEIAKNDRILAIYAAILEKNQAISLKDLAVNGHDAIAAGFSGPEIGKVLSSLLDQVLDNPELNHRDILLEMLQQKT